MLHRWGSNRVPKGLEKGVNWAVSKAKGKTYFNGARPTSMVLEISFAAAINYITIIGERGKAECSRGFSQSLQSLQKRGDY